MFLHDSVPSSHNRDKHWCRVSISFGHLCIPDSAAALEKEKRNEKTYINYQLQLEGSNSLMLWRMDVGISKQCLLCPSLFPKHKLHFLFCNGVSHAREGCLFLLPAVMCSINSLDTLIRLQIQTFKPGFPRPIQSKFISAGRKLFNE